MTKSRPSEPIFSPVVEGTKENESKPSVRAELKQIRKDLDKETTIKAKEQGQVKKDKQIPVKHQQPKPKKKKTKEK